MAGKPGPGACLPVLTERGARQERIFKTKSKARACVAAVLNRLERRYAERFCEIFMANTVDHDSEFWDGE
ncbi:MAG: hypothetical protein GX418_01995 [Clostridiales bacterium]|nr:hypothetical protein [Clostridiales bacterium]